MSLSCSGVWGPHQTSSLRWGPGCSLSTERLSANTDGSVSWPVVLHASQSRESGIGIQTCPDMLVERALECCFHPQGASMGAASHVGHHTLHPDKAPPSPPPSGQLSGLLLSPASASPVLEFWSDKEQSQQSPEEGLEGGSGKATGLWAYPLKLARI